MKKIFTLVYASIIKAGLFTVLLFLLNGLQAYAITYTYSGTGNWNDAGNWSPSYPGTFIEMGHEIIINGSCTVDSYAFIESSSPVTVNGSNTLTIGYGSTLIANDGLTNDGTIQVNGTLSFQGTFNHNGSLQVDGYLSVYGTFNHNGSLQVDGYLYVYGTFNHNGTSASISRLYNGGTVTVNAGKTLTINNGGYYDHSGTLTSNGTFENNGVIYVSTSLSINDTWFTNNGDIDVLFSNLTVDGNISIPFGRTLNSTFGTLTVNADKTLTINQGATFYAGSTNSVYGTLENNGVMYVSNGTSLIINSGGTFSHTGNGAYIDGTLTNNGTVTENANFNGLAINNTGTFTHNGTSATFSKELYSTGEVNVNAGKTLTINNGGTFYQYGTSSVSGTLTNNGTLDAGFGTLTINSSGTFTHDGTSAVISATLTNDGTVTVNAGKTLSVNGTFNNNNTFNHNGILKGEGTFGGTPGFTNPSGGNISPGASPGCMTFPDGFTNDGTITIEVNGTNACSQFDRLNVTGMATLGGTLNVTIGYTPSNGDVITFLDATSITGTFASILGLPSGWSLVYDSPNAGEVSLQYALLPVELASFQAEKQNDHATLLTWRTASEQNNHGFEIQHSNDGRTWQTLAFIPGHGTTQEEQSYTYTDARPLPGLNYYRLKQMDFDGQYEYSDIQSVTFDGDTTTGIQVYPNPVHGDQLNVNLPAEPEGNATMLRMFDGTGRLLHRERLINQFNQTGYGHLPAGIYFIEVTSGYEVWRERLIVQ